jgi:hypothetical protein
MNHSCLMGVQHVRYFDPKQKSFEIVGFAWCYDDAVCHKHPQLENQVISQHVSSPRDPATGGFHLKGWKRPEGREDGGSPWDHLKSSEAVNLKLV